MSSDLAVLTKTAHFAAKKHAFQRRKGKDQLPYINHPLGVADFVTSIGGVNDLVTIQAAMLHDTIEDTDTSYDELVNEFGKTVADVVMEVTDDKNLPRDERKRAQVAHAPHISERAKVVKLCDKLYNLRDLLSNPIPGYTLERVQGYVCWSKLVTAGLRGTNAALEKCLDEIFNGTFEFEGKTYPNCPQSIDECHIYPK